MADFVVVLGADADLWFLPEEDPMRILGFPTPVGSVDITFRTRFAEEGYESPVPREMWIDVRGTSDMPLTDVVSAYGNAGAGFLPAIAFANNAYVATRTRRSATTRRRPQQPGGYFQSFTREERGTVPRAGRCAEATATVNFIMSGHDTVRNGHLDGRLVRVVPSRWAGSRWSAGRSARRPAPNMG